MKNIIPILLLLFLASSCKTQEEIQREQMVDNIQIQMVESQKINADSSVRFSDFEEKISRLRGLIEEKGYKTNQTYSSEFTTLKERLTLIETEFKELQSTNKKMLNEFGGLKVQLNQQKVFLNKVLSSLDSLSKKGTKKKSSKKKRKSIKKKSLYKSALSLYRKAKYNKAKPIFLKVLKKKKSPKSIQAHSIHNLGMIAYINKNYEDSIIWFSRLYTEFPKTGYNKNGLLYLGKAFYKINKKEHGREILTELINKFPNAKKIKEAKSLLKKK
jgi:TolA-binding protein